MKKKKLCKKTNRDSRGWEDKKAKRKSFLKKRMTDFKTNKTQEH